MGIKETIKKLPTWSKLSNVAKGFIIFLFLVGLFSILVPFCGG